MKALKVIIILLLIILAIIIVPTFFMPKEINYQHSKEMSAPPAVLFEQVNCFPNWSNWSPFQSEDMKQRFEGPECGVGSKQLWTDKNMKAEGKQVITNSTPYELIETDVYFTPEDVSKTSFVFEPIGDKTKLTWTYHAVSKGIAGKWVNTLMVKPMLKKAYVKGLDQLEEFTKDKKLPYHSGTIEVKEVESKPALSIKNNTGSDMIGQAMGESYGKIAAYIQKNNLQFTGSPFAIYYKWEPNEFIFDCAIPVNKFNKGNKEIKGINTYAGKVLFLEHRGDYESTQHSWTRLDEYIKENKLEINGNPWEVYVTDPETEKDQSKWITNLYWPIK